MSNQPEGAGYTFVVPSGFPVINIDGVLFSREIFQVLASLTEQNDYFFNFVNKGGVVTVERVGQESWAEEDLRKNQQPEPENHEIKINIP